MYPISNRNISLKIEPNYSSWQTIEYSFIFAKDAIDRGIHGDVVECGVACGNNFAAMCYAGILRPLASPCYRYVKTVPCSRGAVDLVSCTLRHLWQIPAGAIKGSKVVRSIPL